MVGNMIEWNSPTETNAHIAKGPPANVVIIITRKAPVTTLQPEIACGSAAPSLPAGSAAGMRVVMSHCSTTAA